MDTERQHKSTRVMTSASGSIYYIPVAGIARQSLLRTSYEVRRYRLLHHSTNLPPSAAAKLGRMPVRASTQDISICGHCRLRSQLIPESMVKITEVSPLRRVSWLKLGLKRPTPDHLLKGTVSRDFLLLVFFMNQFPPSPRVSH